MTNAELIRHWRIELAQEIAAGKQSHGVDPEARLLEDYIAQHNLRDQYAAAVLAQKETSGFLEGDHWFLLRATPQQRAQAFLQTMTECLSTGT
jgi:hypothetical protein